MRSIGKALVLAAIAFCLATDPALAGKPSYVDPYTETLVHLGNGFPSGLHFTLNLIGKTPDYQCTTPDSVDGVLGNVIFLPDDGRAVQVLMESGAKGPQSRIAATVLEVTDACAGFVGPNDEAVLRLPAHAQGYAVFARAAGRPPEDGGARIFDPAISYVSACDTTTDSMFFLGVVSASGVFTSSQETLDRATGSRTAQDITGLFTWSGMVCYPFGLPAGYMDNSGYDLTYECCDLTDSNGDGVPDLVGACGLEVLDAMSGQYTCGTAWLPCVDYPLETWVFNIADLVDYVWSVENNGIKNLQVRFYPLPLETQPWAQESR